MSAVAKLVLVSQQGSVADGLDLPDNTVAVFDLNNVIHIAFIAYMIYIIFESSSFVECLLLIKMLALVGLCAFAYHIFVSDNNCCVHAMADATTAATAPSELEEEKEILLNTPVSEEEKEEEREEFAELLKDPAVSPPRKSSSPKV